MYKHVSFSRIVGGEGTAAVLLHTLVWPLTCVFQMEERKRVSGCVKDR